MLGKWKDWYKENNEQNLVLPPILYPRYNSYCWQSTYTISYHTLKHDDIICLHWSCSFSVFFFLTFTVEKHRAFDRFFFFFSSLKSIPEKDLEIERKYSIHFGPLKLSHLHFIKKLLEMTNLTFFALYKAAKITALQRQSFLRVQVLLGFLCWSSRCKWQVT